MMDNSMYLKDKKIVRDILFKYQKIYGKKFARLLMKTMLKEIQNDLDDQIINEDEIFAYTE